MNDWYVVGKTTDEVTLARELAAWLTKVCAGVYVFREGPAISQFDWGDQRWLSEAELERLWSVRLFCLEFELYARRLSYVAPVMWQVRIAARGKHAEDLAGCEPLEWIAEEGVLLLGEASGEAKSEFHTGFVLKPNRYQRARLSYPGRWNQGESCELCVQRFQPRVGAEIVCWTTLTTLPIQDARRETQTEPEEYER